MVGLLAVQATFKSLLQHHSSKASILWCSAFFIFQLSHPYMTTGKTIALTRQTFVGKVMSLVFNMLSRLVITFLPRSKRLLISWLQSPSAVTLEALKIVCYCFHCFPIFLPWSYGTRCTRPCFPLSQSLPSGSFLKPLILVHQRADKQNHNHRKLTNLITWTTAFSNSMKLWAMPCRATQDKWVMVDSFDKK